MKTGREISNPSVSALKPATEAGFTIKKQFRTQIRTILKEKLAKTVAATLPYKPAQLSSTDPKDWFVYYSYIDPATGKYKRFKERYGLNNFHQLKVMAALHNKSETECRQIMADEMIRIIDTELKTGFNPFNQQLQVDSLHNDEVLTVITAIYERLKQSATYEASRSYQQNYNRFIKFLTEKQLGQLPPALFSVDHAESFQAWMKDELQLSKKTINSSVSYMGLFWDELGKKVKSNPFREVAPLKDKDFRGIKREEKKESYEPLTVPEIEVIMKELREQKQNGFICFLAFIYYAWARPVEITRLRIRNIDLKGGFIRFTKSDTKNEKGGMVQIVPPLMQYLQGMQLDKIKNKDWFLFSKGVAVGGRGHMEDYRPGPVQLNVNSQCRDKWDRLIERIQKKRKITISKTMYALKHTGNIEYLLQNKGNVDLKWQQRQNRHSSAEMTERYNRKLGAYFIDLENVKFRSFQ